MRPARLIPFIIGVVVGIFIGKCFSSKRVAAQVPPSWEKTEVVAIVMVKPDIGGFSPVTGTSIGNIWRKDEVVPMCLVKPDIGGFSPIRGSSIGNTWPKDEVKPFISVKPYLNGFVPSGPSVF